MTIELSIDGKKVEAADGSTILQACQAQGIEVPTFCWAENLTPRGAAFRFTLPLGDAPPPPPLEELA